MNELPEVVKTIAEDYLGRLRAHLRLVPAAEREEFLLEIQSHIYEAYQQDPTPGEAPRILAVLRNLGEPAEVVAGRLPVSMVRSGTTLSVPLRVLGGIFIAMFGIPLGFGGVAILGGMLATVAGLVAVYYALTGVVLLLAAMMTALGMTRLFLPEFWDKLVAAGFIQMTDFFDRLPRTEQGMLLMICAVLVALAGVGMLRVGRRMRRGLRFFVSLGSEWMVRGAARLRQSVRPARDAIRRWNTSAAAGPRTSSN